MSKESPQLRSPLIPISDPHGTPESSDMSIRANGPQNGVADATASTIIQKKPRASSWKLRYQDFLPSKRISAEQTIIFHSLLNRANDWLRRNADVQVKTCETITWMDSDSKRLGDNEKVVLAKKVAEGANTYYLRGLRLWLVPSQNGRVRSQTICYEDIIPDPSGTIPGLINKANRKIEQNLLCGRIITVETLSVAVKNGNLDSGDIRWSERVEDNNCYAFVLRIFYNKDENVKANIGIRDFVPVLTDDGYEGFSQLVDRANLWIKDQTNSFLINMQSMTVQRGDGPHSETGSACFYCMPGIHNDNPREFFRVLRVVHGRYTGSPAGDTTINVCPFTYETFTPELVLAKGGKSEERMERLRETFSRVHSYLKTSGADIISVETVMNPMQVFHDDEAQGLPDDEIKFLLTTRLYQTGLPSDTDSDLRLLGSTKASLRQKGRGQEGHPGPIFLRSVVNRQYKYRWVVAAVTAFVMMTIIVVLSVIYSN